MLSAIWHSYKSKCHVLLAFSVGSAMSLCYKHDSVR